MTAQLDRLKSLTIGKEPEQIRSILQEEWYKYTIRASFTTGQINLVNWAGGDPSFEFKIMVVDSYEGTVRPLQIIEQCSFWMIWQANPGDPKRCPIIRWWHRNLMNMFIHEASEQFMFDGKHVFDPHNPDTRLPGVIY